MKKVATLENNEDIQLIGLDIGRGYVKAYSQYNGSEKECLFKSVVSLGRTLKFDDYKEPICLEVNGNEYFAGMLAEIEGENPIQNLKDDKTTNTAKKLLYAALNKIAVSENVKIMLGVPNKEFKKSNLEKIQSVYKDMEITIKDKVTGSYKNVTIKDISIFRESDAALMWHVRDLKKFEKSMCMVTVGYRTTELAYYDRNMNFNDKLSDTKEFGNRTALSFVQNKLKEDGIIKELNTIDTSEDYDDLKEIAYNDLSENIEQLIEGTLVNLKEVDIYIGGGTALNLKFDDYEVIEDAQMITAKGLYLVATKTFK
ncbi:ParM/StbA family protein [Clostridium sp.]|uniref:ParM/StbA family protein n=1 Tax=Clostridium sp. TaxID=1506 RepID=UPI0026140DCF|nr:ParM/StbA family protein [Clostridium sp.]